MKPFFIYWLGILFFFLISCESTSFPTDSITSIERSQNSMTYLFEILDTIILEEGYNNQHYRGLEINENNAYITGSGGSIIYYNHLSKEISYHTDPDSSNFRDIEIINSKIIAMGITEPASLKTFDQSNWQYQYIDSLGFIDGIDFWKNGIGICMGDPTLEQPFIIRTVNCGESWANVEWHNLPKFDSTEAGFAASGTSLQCLNNGFGYIGWGGNQVRVFKTKDYGQSWSSMETPMKENQTGYGIYSLHFKDVNNGIAVGGCWEDLAGDSSKIYTKDGINWNISEGVQGYRSCVTHLKDDIYISTGSKATDITYDGGKSWLLLDSIGFNTIKFFDEQYGIGIGNHGHIATFKLTLNE